MVKIKNKLKNNNNMKKVNWIIEKYLFEEYEDKLATVIKNSGMNVIIHDDNSFDVDFDTHIRGTFGVEDIVITHSSLQEARRTLKTPLYPGIFLTLENYECYNYYGYFGNNLLNSQYIMMGLNDVMRNKSRIFQEISTDSVFIRPSNGYKTFTGQVLSKEYFDTEFDTLCKSYGGLDTNTIVLFSPCQDIMEEYRFVVINGKLISGATYFDAENKGTYNPHYDKLCEDVNASEFAESMIGLYQPDQAYTIDVCKLSDGSYKVIELNSFFCANWYGNDLVKIVDTVNEMCIAEHNDVYGDVQ